MIAQLSARPLWQTCYGGSFAARREGIVRWPLSFWRWLSSSLSRGDNILEGHFAERTWAKLLAPPLSLDQEMAILCASRGVDASNGHVGGGCACGEVCGKLFSMAVAPDAERGGSAPRAVSVRWHD